MPGCCVPLCAGSTTKGLRCFRFPRDKERRKVWEAKVRRQDWNVNDNSRICERHFEEDQFEGKRKDGRRLLKSTAVPTLFDFGPQPKRREPLAPRPFPSSTAHGTAVDSSPAPKAPPDLEQTPPLPENTHEGTGEQVDIFWLSVNELRKELQDARRKRNELEESLSQAKRKVKKH
nr:THAP domain-containing protein 1-like [Dermacentor andersoni]